MRRNLLLLIALITWSSVLLINSRTFQVDDSKAISGIHKSPGLAMEFARNQQEVKDLLGDPDQTPVAAATTKNWQAMRRQQYLDFVLIVLYWSFFVFAISAAMRASGAAPRLGWLVAILISLAALADILEDVAILETLQSQPGNLYPFPFGVAKWLCFFGVLGFSSPLFLRYPGLGSFSFPANRRIRWLILVTGVAFLAASLLGLAAVAGAYMGKGSLFAGASIALLVSFLAVLVLFLAGAGLAPSQKAATRASAAG
jgi:hypothetical protein